jgi:hypothetical protein
VCPKKICCSYLLIKSYIKIVERGKIYTLNTNTRSLTFMAWYRYVGSSCPTSGTRRVNLVTNPVISREWGKDREVFTTSGTYPWSFVTQIFHNGQPSHGEWGSCYLIFTFICMFCRSFFVLLYFFFWPLCCLTFFDIRILIAGYSSRCYNNLPIVT